MHSNGLKLDESISFKVKEFFAGLLLLLVLGFPLWMPLVLMVTDLFKVNNPVIQMVLGNNEYMKGVMSKLIQYAFSFIPAAFIYVWYKSSGGMQRDSEIIDLDTLVSSINSDQAQKLSWKPNGISGNPANNKEWMQVKPALWAFKNTYNFRLFTYPVGIVAILYCVVMSISAISIGKSPFLAFITNAGFLMSLLALALNYVFYLMSFGGLMLRLKTNEIMVGKYLLPITSIEGIQVLRKQQSHNEGGGEIYSVYEANILYENNQRYTFLNHGDLQALCYQISQLNHHLDVSVFVDETVISDVKQHNMEANLTKK